MVWTLSTMNFWENDERNTCEKKISLRRGQQGIVREDMMISL